MVDNDFLAQIREVEQIAAEQVAKAREAAQAALDDARRQATEIVRQAHVRAAEETKNILAEAEARAERQTAESRKIAADEAAKIRDGASSRIGDAAGNVVDRVVNGYADR